MGLSQRSHFPVQEVSTGVGGKRRIIFRGAAYAHEQSAEASPDSPDKFKKRFGHRHNPAVEVSASDRAKAAKIKGVRPEMLEDPDFWKTLSKYIEFHGCWPTTLEPRDIPQEKYLVNMGKALDVSYEPTESQKKSNKYGSSWLHEFNEGGNPKDKKALPDRLCTSDGKSIITHGGKFGVKDWVRG